MKARKFFSTFYNIRILKHHMLILSCIYCNAFISPREFHYFMTSNLYKGINIIKDRCGKSQIGSLMNGKTRVSTWCDMKGFVNIVAPNYLVYWSMLGELQGSKPPKKGTTLPEKLLYVVLNEAMVVGNMKRILPNYLYVKLTF